MSASPAAPVEPAPRRATAADITQVVALVNGAYRGESGRRGWTTESDLLGGQRVDEPAIAELLAQPEERQLWLWPSPHDAAALAACVVLERTASGGYLGMLTVRPDLQNAGFGRKMIEWAEAHLRALGLLRLEMTVISERHELIAWYERRGFARTGEVRPFPMQDARFGAPKRAHLEFVVLAKALR